MWSSRGRGRCRLDLDIMRNLHHLLLRPRGAIPRSQAHLLGLPALHQGHKFTIGSQIFWLLMIFAYSAAMSSW